MLTTIDLYAFGSTDTSPKSVIGLCRRIHRDYYAIPLVVWPFLRRVMTKEMPKSVIRHADIVAVTPFVLVLSLSFGLAAGIPPATIRLG
jgi:hypothetical protein